MTELERKYADADEISAEITKVEIGSDEYGELIDSREAILKQALTEEAN
jgi:hypothetical protein